jgi:flagellar basal body-associated protein FliL
MKRPALVAAALLAFAASPALGEDAKKADNTQAVTISPVALPIVVNGRLVNYVFVTVRLDLSGSANAIKLRDKEPYFRDALVRVGHRTPFTLLSDLTKIDEAKLQTAMLREANAIAGAGSVRGVTVVSQAPKSMRVSASG